MSYQLKEDWVIPAGTVFKQAPVKIERVCSFVEALIEVSPDATASITICVDDRESLDLLERKE